MVQRNEQVELPEALLLFETWPTDDDDASFRTRIVTSTSNLVIANGNAQVAWVQKRSEGIFSSLIGIGRTRNNDIVLPMPGVSKYHAYIQLDEASGVYSIADAGSKNGTHVDGILLEARSPKALSDAALVSFAGNGCRFHLTASLLESVSTNTLAL